MSSAYPRLCLRLPGQHDGMLLVGGTDAVRLCAGGGYATVDVREVAWAIQSAGRRIHAELRAFLSCRPGSRVDVTALSDGDVVRRISSAIRRRELVAVREADPDAGASDSAARQRRLVRDLSRHGRLTLDGTTYRLVVDVALASLPGRDNYHVVGLAEAERVLKAIAADGATAPELRELLRRAIPELSADWRPPLRPDGLVLLRRLVVAQSVAAPEAVPITPSQMRDAMLSWITIEAVDGSGKPWQGMVELTLTDGSKKKLKLAGGSFHQAKIPPGTATVKFLAEETPQEGFADSDTSSQRKPVVKRARLVGMLFDANKCFLLPKALPGIRSIVAMHRKQPNAEVLIVGHAGGDEDLAGGDIALARAEMLAAYLKSDPQPWLAWFGKDKDKQSRWGTREVQLMLSALPKGGKPFYQGNASGVTGEQTTAAVTAFQKYSNLNKGTRLTVDGKAGPQTCQALVRAYMGLEDTTLAEHIAPLAHGCEGHFEDSTTAAGLVPDDRRLEVFLFPNGIDPAPAGPTSSAESSSYGKWLAQVGETQDFEHHGINVLILDASGKPVPDACVTFTGPTSGTAQADAHGFVSLLGLAAGQYTVHAEREGYTIEDSQLTYPTAKTVEPEPSAPPGTKPIHLRLHMDPAKAAALKEKFRLFSNDGAYSRTEADDRIKGDDYLDLVFENCPVYASYALEVTGTGIKPYRLFEEVPFARLAGQR